MVHDSLKIIYNKIEKIENSFFKCPFKNIVLICFMESYGTVEVQ